METNFRVAVKAFITNNGKLLLLKRRSNDVHKPGVWDIPGGRLEVGEDPYEGLHRELKEEAGAEGQILLPIDVHHFVRDDGQKITMLIFLCKLNSEEVILSEEHEEYKWVDLSSERDQVPEWLNKTVESFLKFGLEKY
jgi:8-oxo-dGTP diphosphatase